MTKQLLLIGTAVMTTLLAALLLWQFRLVVAYVLLSLALAAALRPLIRRRPGRRFAVRLAVIILAVMVLGSFGFLLFLAGGAARAEVQQLAQQVSV